MSRWLSANKWKLFAVTLTGIGLACAEMHGMVTARARDVWQHAEEGLRREAAEREAETGEP